MTSLRHRQLFYRITQLRSDTGGERYLQAQAYRSGEALRKHALSAHNGTPSADCHACRELQEKTKLARETDG